MQRAAISHDYGSALYQYCLQKIIMHEKLSGRRPPCDPRGLGPESGIWVSPQRSQWGLSVGAIQRLFLFLIFLSEFVFEFWAWIVKWDEISTWFASLIYMDFVVICADICDRLIGPWGIGVTLWLEPKRDRHLRQEKVLAQVGRQENKQFLDHLI